MAKKEKAPKKPMTFKRFLRNFCIFLVIFFLLNMVAADILFRFIFPRYDYKEGTVDPVFTEEDAAHYTRECVTFASGKNTLHGHLYTNENAIGILLLAHGSHSHGDRMLPFVKYFYDAGYSVLTFDGTGSYESEGKNSVGLVQMKKDVLAAIDYIKETPVIQDLPLALLGHSMGGYAVVSAADETEGVSCVICLSGFDKPNDIMFSQAKGYAGPAAYAGYPFMCLKNIMLFGFNCNESAHEQLQESTIPMLIVQGSGDQVITDDLSITQYETTITNPIISFITVEEAYRNEHSTLWLTQECAEYTLQVLDEEAPLTEYDPEKLFQLDLEFMETLNDFLTTSTQR